MILGLNHILAGFHNLLAFFLTLTVLQTIRLRYLFNLGDDPGGIGDGPTQRFPGCFNLELKFHVLVGLVDFVLDDVGEDGVLGLYGGERYG